MDSLLGAGTGCLKIAPCDMASSLCPNWRLWLFLSALIWDSYASRDNQAAVVAIGPDTGLRVQNVNNFAAQHVTLFSLI